MLTGELRSQVDGIWNDFWSGGLANPLQVIEQITYLIFIKRLDEMQELEERKATTLGLLVLYLGILQLRSLAVVGKA